MGLYNLGSCKVCVCVCVREEGQCVKWVGMDSCGSVEVSQQLFASDSREGVEVSRAAAVCPDSPPFPGFRSSERHGNTPESAGASPIRQVPAAPEREGFLKWPNRT